jgi:hypothetical protein
MVLPPRLRRHSASAALAVGAVFFSALKEAIEPVQPAEPILALKEAIEPVQPVEPVEPVEPVKALAVAVLAEGQEAVQVEVLSVALQQAVQVEVELGAQA